MIFKTFSALHPIKTRSGGDSIFQYRQGILPCNQFREYPASILIVGMPISKWPFVQNQTYPKFTSNIYQVLPITLICFIVCSLYSRISLV